MSAVHVSVSSWRAPSLLRLPPQTALPSAAFRQPLLTLRRPYPLKARPVHRCAVASSGKYIRENYLVKKVSAKEVYDLVQGKRNVPLVIDFYATWCGPCILMAQDLEMLAVEYESNVMIVKVDTDDEYEFARDMQVRGLPTLFFVSPDPSKDAIRTEGLIPIEMMRKIIETEM
ncbi:Thioredoxin-like protein [Nymphaea thermarum]|nr:Thioredoxin-like protein [Nymphaea thermarum]